MMHHFPTLMRVPRGSLSQWGVISGVFAATLALGMALVACRSREFAATCVVAIDSAEEALSLELPEDLHFDSYRFVKEQAEVIGGENFLMRVAAQEGLARRWGKSHAGTFAQLRRGTSVSRGGLNEIKILYRSPEANEAVELANAIAGAYLLYWQNLHKDRYGDKLRSLVADYEKFRAEANVKIAAFEVLNAHQSSPEEMRAARQELIALQKQNAQKERDIEKVKAQKEWLLSAARIKEKASPASVNRDASMASALPLIFLFSVLAAAVAAGVIFRKQLTRPKTAELARAVGARNVLLLPPGEISSAQSAHQAAFLKICDSVLTRFPSPQGVVTTVIPCLEDESVAEVCGEVAKAFAQSGYLTILIEGNLKAPRIHDLFEATSHPGLSECLRGDFAMSQCAVKTRHDRLWLIPGGTVPAETSRLLESAEMKALLTDAATRFDIIVVSGAPLLSGVDSLILAELSNLAFLCAEAGNASREILAKCRCAIDQAGGTFGGLILTNVESGEFALSPSALNGKGMPRLSKTI